mmetsp:Transcript_25909/g.86259  ORF Transcript_25909/g.86259 Transcript_25909/m.86259 type:complete len:324 (-) Transcript_25909:82-1053(-)
MSAVCAERQSESPNERMEQKELVASVTVWTLAGRELAVVAPVPKDVASLKAVISAQCGIPVALQRLVEQDGDRVLDDEDESLQLECSDFLLVVDETPMSSWDHTENPCHAQLQIDGGVVKCPELRVDFVNVITKEPMRSGVHYFQFKMDHIGDEQWCGVVADPGQAGQSVPGRFLTAWAYYCGRMGTRFSSIVDGLGSLHAQGHAVKQFAKLQPAGDVIGMLVDLDRDVPAIAFELNGTLQGACPIPKDTPLWVLTVVDTSQDHVELVKLPLADAPQESIEALRGALLEVSQGTKLTGWVGDAPDIDDIPPESWPSSGSDCEL